MMRQFGAVAEPHDATAQPSFLDLPHECRWCAKTFADRRSW